MSLIKEYLEKTEPARIPGRDIEVPPVLRKGGKRPSHLWKMVVPVLVLCLAMLASGYTGAFLFRARAVPSPAAAAAAAVAAAVPDEIPRTEAAGVLRDPRPETVPPGPIVPAAAVPEPDARSRVLEKRLAAMESAVAKAALVMERQIGGNAASAPKRPSPAAMEEKTPDAGPREYFNLGASAQKSGNLALAMSFYRKCLVLDPQHSKALVNLAVIHMTRGNNGRAMQVFEKLYQSEPDNLDVLVNLGILNLGKGETDQAETLFKEAIALHGDHPKALFNLAYLYQETNRNKEAVQAYIRTVAVDRDNYKACLGAAGVLEKQKRYREAVAFYEKALAILAVKKNSRLKQNIGGRVRLLQRRGLNMAQKE